MRVQSVILRIELILIALFSISAVGFAQVGNCNLWSCASPIINGCNVIIVCESFGYVKWDMGDGTIPPDNGGSISGVNYTYKTSGTYTISSEYGTCTVTVNCGQVNCSSTISSSPINCDPLKRIVQFQVNTADCSYETVDWRSNGFIISQNDSPTSSTIVVQVVLFEDQTGPDCRNPIIATAEITYRNGLMETLSDQIICCDN
jgi:hypothetical protein